ncbi:MAG TPA: ATP-binding protein [Thermoanaerobaculia bacterium]|nr:ATP-binding protein [Thermoanaerobaculia bacterium]
MIVESFLIWPLFASLAVALVARELRAGRRRTVLNEALHELRRPLQAIALAAGPGAAATANGAVESSVRLASAALERIDHEVNGGGGLRRPAERIEARALVEAAVRRWRSRASVAGGSLSLRWRAGRAVVEGDRAELGQALDNLIVNAIEHGGPAITVEARPRDGRLRIVVADSGRASRPPSREGGPAETIARLSGRRRHGHGLAVVRRVASEHDGRFVLRRSERGSLAVLELPRAGEEPGAAA